MSVLFEEIQGEVMPDDDGGDREHEHDSGQDAAPLCAAELRKLQAIVRQRDARLRAT